MFVSGGEERMVEGNIFSIITLKVILMNDNLLSIITPNIRLDQPFMSSEMGFDHTDKAAD